ncbi:helix-turn-helix transcriptional regulator [Deinococcus sp. YIM 77859]|uniref:helix-turn-helix domain-containing protein n=1 Tax=Deinococcus sp. YIM 77859 TaxID=1540221 RepID=UPI00054DBD3B|nr:helix-turn-helix transcriptional regulator [Deinococcus sp. YIM 77859]
MNDEIRAKVDARLREKGMTRAELARATGIHANHITRALNNTGGRGGNVPPVWQAILEALDLRLTVEPGAMRGGEGKGREQRDG